MFMAISAAIMIFFGVAYIREWRDTVKYKLGGYERDMVLGIGACTVGVTLLGLSVYLARRVANARPSGE